MKTANHYAFIQLMNDCKEVVEVHRVSGEGCYHLKIGGLNFFRQVAKSKYFNYKNTTHKPSLVDHYPHVVHHFFHLKLVVKLLYLLRPTSNG